MTIHVVSQHAIAELSESKRAHSDLGVRVEIELKDGKAPSGFRIFRAGLNTSTKGDYSFTEASQSKCMAYQAKRGMPTVIDYEHASRYATFAADPQKAGRAAGRCKLECKNGELWATGVKWTKAATEAIESGEQDLFSPVFAYDRETMEIGECTSIGLTATPALDNLEPLAAKDGAEPESTTMEKTLVEFLANLRKQMALSEGAGAVEALMAIAELKQSSEKLLTAIGATSLSEGLGKVEALKANGARIAELTTQIAKVESDGKKARIGVLIEAALTAKKVTPAGRPFLEKMGDDEVALKAYLDTLTPIPGATVYMPPPPGMPPPAGGATAELTASDMKVAGLLGYTSPEQLATFAATKARGINVAPLTPKAA